MVLNATAYIAPEQNLISSIIQSLPQSVVDKISFVVDLSKILLIIIIIYLIVIIISKIVKFRDSSNLAKIAKNVEEINQKLSSKSSRKKRD